MSYMIYYKTILMLFCIIPFSGMTQSAEIDSLIKYCNSAPNDTHKLTVLTAVIEGISEDAVWTIYNERLGPLSQKLMLSDDIAIKQRAQKSYSDYLNNKGYLSNNKGEIELALNYFHQSLDIQEKLGDKSGQSYSLNNIGFIYYNQKQYVRALECYNKSLVLLRKLKDKGGEAKLMGNIGIIYERTGDLKKALTYYFISLNIRKAINDRQGIGYALQNIGTVYLNQKNYTIALYYFKQSLDIRRLINDDQGVSYSLSNLGKIYLQQHNLAQARLYSIEALDIAKKIGYPENISNAATQLEDIYHQEHQYDLAYDMLKLAVKMRDSISNDELHKNTVRKQLQYEFEKKEVITQAEQEKKELLYKESAKQQRIIIYAVCFGLVLCMIFGMFIYKRFKITQRQNDIIQKQKQVVETKNHIIEEKQKEIVDSINYAKRIQTSLLGKHAIIDKYFEKNFILFKPKDIVSGDFYWTTEHNNKFYLAVCDCTGHGVPGAFMSLLNIGFLSEAIKEKNIEQPNEVFNYVRKRLESTISTEGQQDGMDGILVCFDKSTNTLTYSAAHNQPILINNKECIELPKDKMPIGVGETYKSFTLQTINVNKGDFLYLYTDGYADQFGGPKGKKFKYKTLNDLLLSISDEDVIMQQEILNSTISEWMGNLEQVDDILLVGIRI